MTEAELRHNRERQEAAIRAEPLMNSAIPAPAALHTDRLAYVVARDSVLKAVVPMQEQGFPSEGGDPCRIHLGTHAAGGKSHPQKKL